MGLSQVLPGSGFCQAADHRRGSIPFILDDVLLCMLQGPYFVIDMTIVSLPFLCSIRTLFSFLFQYLTTGSFHLTPIQIYRTT